jgi:cobalt-zinc-cadmium efflux system outer membrane protein
VKAGATSPVELLRAEAAVGHTETQLRQAQRDLATARTALSATWGNPAALFTEAVGDLTPIHEPPPLVTLLDSIQHNPDLARWTAEIEQRDAALALEKARAIPDLTVGLGGRHFADNGDVALVGGFSVPLPVFDRNQGSILAADRRRGQAAAARNRAVVTVSQAISAAHDDLCAAYSQATILREQVLPKAEGAFTGARDAYQRGLMRFLDVLDAQRTLFETRDQYVQTVAVYHSAAADVERLSGQSIGAPDRKEGR